MFNGYQNIDIDLMRTQADLMDNLLSSSDYNQELTAKLLDLVEATADFYSCKAASSYREQAITAIRNESDIKKLKHSLVVILRFNADSWERADKEIAAEIKKNFKSH